MNVKFLDYIIFLPYTILTKHARRAEYTDNVAAEEETERRKVPRQYESATDCGM